VKQFHVCKKCFCVQHGKDIKLANNIEFTNFRETAFSDSACPDCGSSDIQKIWGIDATFVRGYGLKDRKSVCVDVNIATLTNNDPYERDKADKDELILKLKRKKEINTKKKSYGM